MPSGHSSENTVAHTVPGVAADRAQHPHAALRLIPPTEGKGGREALWGYGWAGFACALVTALSLAVREVFDPANLVLLYLMAVVLVSARFGKRPGIVASVLAVLAFDFFLIPPYHSLSVADTQYVLTFAIMLTVSLIISHLTAHLRYQVRMAHYRERRTAALFELSKELSAALTNEQVVEIASRHLENMFLAEVLVFLPGPDGNLFPPHSQHAPAFAPSRIAHGPAQEFYEQASASGDAGDFTIAGSALYLPLRAPMRTRGVLALAPNEPDEELGAEQRRLLQICASQIALAVERVHYVEVAQDAQLEMESERLRNSLLSALSHDVRTPLTAIVGLASTLAGGKPLPRATRQELSSALEDEAIRMNHLVTNLLDMARLQAGPIRLNCQWQLLEEVVGSSLNLLSRGLEGRPVAVSIPPTIPLLRFDAVLIERVLCNLLENAAKYSPAGSAISIGAEHQGEEVLVWVADCGPGIPAGMEEDIFVKFTQGRHESANSGVGLGLSICRTIVMAHEGRIWVEKSQEGGARFIFTLPVGSPPDDASATWPESCGPGDFHE